MLMTSGIEASRVKRPTRTNAPPMSSVYPDSAALKAGAGIPQPSNRSAIASRLCTFPQPVSKKK